MPIEPAATRLLRALASVLERFGGRWYLFAQALIVGSGSSEADPRCDMLPLSEAQLDALKGKPR